MENVFLTGKMSPPGLRGIVSRPRLFEQLDACRLKRVAWVAGPAGSGKTVLVASYLENRRVPCVWYRIDGADADPATFFFHLGQAFQQFLPPRSGPLPLLLPEHSPGLDAFALSFFERVTSMPDAPRVIVFDDYHEIPADAQIHQALSNAFTRLPVEVTFIVVSRELPPARFARMRVDKLLGILQPNLLNLTIDEAQSAIDATIPGLPPKLVAAFHGHTRGWAAGLAILAEHHRLTGGKEVDHAVRTPQEIFDYFASELFEKAPRDYQDFLLKTSVFNEMTAEMAEELTGLRNSRDILSVLNRNHFFTEVYPDRSAVYLYHPLFHEFLRAKTASCFGPLAVRDLVRQAALIAEGHGLPYEAAELYLASSEWQKLTALLERLAVEAVAEGRARQLIAWLDKVPQKEFDQHPRLLYWLGIAELFLGRHFKARARLEVALELFDFRQDAEGVFRSWSAIVDTYFLEMVDWHPLDRWIAYFDELKNRYLQVPAGPTELRVALSGFTAHVLRQSSQEIISAWRGYLDTVRADNDLATQLQAGLIKSLQLIWCGDYHHNRLLLNQLREAAGTVASAPAVPLLTLRLLEAMHFWLTVQPQRCRAAAEEGLELARSSGVTVWNFHYWVCLVESALIEGECGEARRLLGNVARDLTRANSMERFYYHLLSALIDFLQNDTVSALSHLEVGHSSAMTLGSPLYEGLWNLAMAQVKLKRKAYGEAPRFLERALTTSLSIGSRNLEFISLLYRAQLLFELGCREDALISLENGMKIGRDRNYLHFIWWVPSAVADLCAVALRHDIETEYVRNLVRSRGLFPSSPPVDVPQWPWEITIHCLGRFEVQVHGAPVKIPKKPLELLKAIIAHGGTDVRYERIADLLWPDADGDTGLGNLKITLHRLRQLLGENSLQFKDGKLSLDARRVWVDIQAFERAALKASAHWCKERELELSVDLTESALALYHGQFLKDDDEQGVHLLREKLSRMFISLVSLIGSRYLTLGHLDQAIAIYQRGVEMEPLAEVLYEGLIRSYAAAGYRADGVQAFRRYERAMRRAFDIQPAKRLTQLIASL